MPSFVVGVKNERNGMFQKVADATDSTLFEGRVSLAGLWALSSDLPPTKAVGDALRPIYIAAVSLAVAERHDALLNVLSPKVAQITFPPPQTTQRSAETDADTATS